MAAIIDYLCLHYQENPSLAEIAARIGMSEFHFQRVFRRWVGISPKRFMQHLALQDVRERLLEGHARAGCIAGMRAFQQFALA